MEIPATEIVTTEPNQQLVNEVQRYEKVVALSAWRSFVSTHSQHTRMVNFASLFSVLAIFTSISLSLYLFRADGFQAIVLGALLIGLMSAIFIALVLLRQFAKETMRIFLQFMRTHPDHARHINPLTD